jgi:hypothetical protein
MERFRGQLMDGDRALLDEIEGTIAIQEGPGLQEWRGWFWLPDGAQVRTGDTYCLIRDDAWARELIVKSSGPGATGVHVAVFEGNRRFEW